MLRLYADYTYLSTKNSSFKKIEAAYYLKPFSNIVIKPLVSKIDIRYCTHAAKKADYNPDYDQRTYTE